MSYAHALVLTEDQSSPEIRIACNGDAQHWGLTGTVTVKAGAYARYCRETVLAGPDLIARVMIEDEA